MATNLSNKKPSKDLIELIQCDRRSPEHAGSIQVLFGCATCLSIEFYGLFLGPWCFFDSCSCDWIWWCYMLYFCYINIYIYYSVSFFWKHRISHWIYLEMVVSSRFQSSNWPVFSKKKSRAVPGQVPWIHWCLAPGRLVARAIRGAFIEKGPSWSGGTWISEYHHGCSWGW